MKVCVKFSHEKVQNLSKYQFNLCPNESGSKGHTFIMMKYCLLAVATVELIKISRNLFERMEESRRYLRFDILMQMKCPKIQVICMHVFNFLNDV
ncbi:hypothetical protein Avbf_01216 [Armadillidium vulgare]|nr:hypothetical protein Avbf_01216 [Armadillidium vulgare]